MNILRITLATVSAVVAAAAVIAGSEALVHASLSGDARFAAVAVGYGLGAFAGSTIATIFRVRYLSTAVTALLAVLAAINFFAFPHPVWFAPLAVVMLVLGWFGGRRMGLQLSGQGDVSR